MSKICFGCGSKLQYSDPSKEGYVPEKRFEDSVYCQRCFRMMHYGEKNGSNTPKSISSIVNSINKDDKYVIFLVDFLSLSDKVIDIFNKIKKKKMLLVSKSDVIPKSVKLGRLKEYIKDYYEVNSEIRFVSTLYNTGVIALLDYLKDNNIRECYVLGLSNSGKSTLINKIIDLSGSKLNKTTVSSMANTTLDFIRLPIDKYLTLIDSPGFIIEGIKENNQDGYLKPKSFQIKRDETLKIGDNTYLMFDRDTNITLYVNNDLYVKKYYKDNVTFNDSLLVKDNSDIVMIGDGFINVKQECLVSISNLNMDTIEVRKSIFGGIDEQD